MGFSHQCPCSLERSSQVATELQISRMYLQTQVWLGLTHLDLTADAIFEEGRLIVIQIFSAFPLLAS